MVQIYQFMVPFKILELSFSVVKLKGFQHQVSVVLMNRDLRLFWVTNKIGFKGKDNIIEIHGQQDLYKKRLEQQMHALKIDLCPKLNAEQPDFLVIHYEGSKNMIKYSYQRVVLKWDTKDAKYYKNEILYPFIYNLDEYHSSTTWSHIFHITTSFELSENHPDKRISIVQNFIMKHLNDTVSHDEHQRAVLRQMTFFCEIDLNTSSIVCNSSFSLP